MQTARRQHRDSSAFLLITFVLSLVGNSKLACAAEALVPLAYNNPGLTVDLGVGLWAWPLPIDYDGDGDWDLVVTCPDVPYNGTYLFENPGGGEMPVFRPGRRIAAGPRNVQVSQVGTESVVTTPGKVYPDFLQSGFEKPEVLLPQENIHSQRVRANQWKLADLNGDESLDLVVGVGDWTDYGWDNAYDGEGNWTNGPLRGFVYWLPNLGTNGSPHYGDARLLQTANGPIEVYGMPSPNLADFDGDGDLDLLCGEFLDGFTYFRNEGTPTEPEFAAGQRLVDSGRRPVRMDLQMITPTAVDWNHDGHVDLVVGDEDGRVAWVQHSGANQNGLPIFEQPRYFQQQAERVKFGALVTPFATDWDEDGDTDLICGNTAGYVGYIENLGGDPPRWAKPSYLEAGGKTLRIQAGSNGSIQGPAEAKWGYTTLSVADWDHDGRDDVIFNSIWGRVMWCKNRGALGKPQLDSARRVQVDWPENPPKPAWIWWTPQPDELATQWRTTPWAEDINADGLVDLVSLDHDGYLAFYERSKVSDQSLLLPPQRIFLNEDGKPLRLNAGIAGKSGRRKFCLHDWDEDGRLDLLVNGKNVDWYRNIGREDRPWIFRPRGPVIEKKLAGHTTSPTMGDINGDGREELIIGAEDGFLYVLERPHE